MAEQVRGRRPLGPVIATVLIALTLAALGGGLGGWLGWRSAPPLPDDSTAAAMARAVLPRGIPLVVERHDPIYGYVDLGPTARLWGGSDYRAGYVKLLVDDGGDAARLLADIRDVMGLSGWQVSGNLVGAGTSGIRRRTAISVYPATSDGRKLTAPHPNDDVVVEISRAEPGRVMPFTVIGYLLGFAVGWLLGRRLVDRTHREGQVRRRMASSIGVSGLLLLLPATVLTTGTLCYTVLLAPGAIPPPPAWGQYLLPGVRAMSTVGLLLLGLAAILAAVAPVPDDEPPQPDAA